MDTRLIETAIAVHTYKSYSEAAYQISLSPSAVSKHIVQLESELGIRLFNRQTKLNSVSLTKEGEEIIPVFYSFIDEYHSILNRVEKIKASREAHINISAVPLVGTIGENEILADFYMHFPDITVEDIRRPVKEQIRMLKCGLLDASFLYTISSWHPDHFMVTEFDPELFGYIPIYESKRLLFGISENNPLSSKKSFTANDLKGQTFIFSHAVEAHKSPLPDLKPDDFKWRIMDFRQKSLILDFVAKGGGILPLACKPVRHPGVCYIPAEGWSEVSYGFFIYRKNTGSPALRSLINLVKEYSLV